MIILFFIVSAVYIFGSWGFSKAYKNYGKKKKTCIAGIIISALSFIISAKNIWDCIQLFSLIGEWDKKVDRSMYYAFSSNIYGPDEAAANSMGYLLFLIPWIILSILSVHNYYKAFKKNNTIENKKGDLQ